MLQVHLLISGIVQGVGFRNFVKYQAKKLEIFGWVKNLPNGTVEAVLQSYNKEHLDKMIEKCRRGPYLAEVKSVDIEWNEIGELEYKPEFVVRKE